MSRIDKQMHKILYYLIHSGGKKTISKNNQLTSVIVKMKSLVTKNLCQQHYVSKRNSHVESKCLL
ncbi:hypothetical protein QTP88_013465 [Uroleucon formosanum]